MILYTEIHLEENLLCMLIFFLSLQSGDSVIIKSTELKQHEELQSFRSQQEWQLTEDINVMLLFATLEIPFAVFSLI